MATLDSAGRALGWGKRAAIGLALIAAAVAQPRLKTKPVTSYQVGEAVDGRSLLLDSGLHPMPLAGLIKPDTRLVVLIIFGGAARTSPSGEPPRGGLWCEDSFDDLALQRALLHQFKGLPVQFIPVAVPPVYHHQFGYSEGVFLEHPDDHPDYLAAARSFVEATEKLRGQGLIPFETLYYDPKFRLAQNFEERRLGPEFGQVYPWQGKLKWHLDPRKYGTPTIWLLDSHLRVLREPFFGNDYDADPPQILYGFHDVREAIERLLEK